MYRPRGNLSFTRKPSIDPTIGNELAKLARAIPNLSYGDQFPGRQSTFGDMHFYTGEDTTDYKKDNWYIRPVDADSVWQPMNATSVKAENIQTGTIGSGVKVMDSLQLLGGEMLGKVLFHESQTFKPEMLESGVIPPGVRLAGYVPDTGGSFIGNIDLTDHSLSSVNKIYGFDNLIYVDLGIDGHLFLASDVHMVLTSPSIDLNGAVNVVGSLSVGGAPVLLTETDPIFTSWLQKTNECEEAVLAGQVLYMQANSKVKLAKADSTAHTNVCGLAIANALIGGSCTFIQDGKLTMADWTNVVGAATLSVGATYYLDPTNFGKLTTVAPTTVGQYVMSIGLAVASDTLELDIEQGILL